MGPIKLQSMTELFSQSLLRVNKSTKKTEPRRRLLQISLAFTTVVRKT